MILGLGERVGRLLARSDCSARHVLYMFERGDWQVDGGGDSIIVGGMKEAVRGCLRGAQSSDEGRSMWENGSSVCGCLFQKRCKARVCAGCQRGSKWRVGWF